ncbi:KAP family P-loop NTPase fold protein [Enterobacter sp. DC3]|uniref:KAP family P-loop NTPase fold protein n=1 Tax=Enterobacter sp. DC3 TaxID=1395579 RepID=UPI003FCEA691
MEQFRELLTKIHTKSDKKVIFIIDELDRARPDFALDLLEKIKHIFSVEGFVFLLVVNREQFEKSIECRYGNINARLYLNKFIHYWFTLPKKSIFSDGCQEGYERSTLTQYLLTLDKGNNLLTGNGSLVKTLAYLLEANNCSLREAERCYSTFAVMTEPQEINFYRHDIYLVAFGLIAFIKVFDQSLLIEIGRKSITLEDILARLSISTSIMSTAEIHYILMLLNYHRSTDEQLSKAEMRERYAFMTGMTGRRVKWFETMSEKLEGFTVSR